MNVLNCMTKPRKLLICLLVFLLCAVLAACATLPTTPPVSTQAVSREAPDQTEAPQPAATTDDPVPTAAPAPQAAPGYVFYENDIFSSEIPEGWELQRTKILYVYDTILEPHEGKSIWSSITINCGGYKDGDVEALLADYTKTGLVINNYDITIAGQPATVIERGGGELGLSMRDIYSEAPSGQRFMLHFNCPNNGKAFSFEAIQEPMDHFLQCLRWKSGGSVPADPASVTEPPAPITTTASTEPLLFFDSVEIEDFAGFEGMTRSDLKARYGEPNFDDGNVMTYDSVSWNGWIGSMRFFFDDSIESCKTNCASWTTPGDDSIFNELCDALKSRGWPGESYSPKDGQLEKAYIINDFELIAGNENSASGKWTYLFARLHT